jgi:hypothetical protein
MGFALDRGQYGEARKQIEAMLTEARRAKVNANIVRFLGEQALLEHVLADKNGETKDDREIADINETGGEQIFVDASTIEAIDALLAGDKSVEELEKALKEPVEKLVSVTQSLAWSQQYAPAQQAMALLIDKLSRKLGANSPLVVNLKLQYASRLLQKIINPASPLTPSQRKELVGEPMALLDTPMTLSSGSDLWQAKSNFALAQAISGNDAEARKLRDEVAGAYDRDTQGEDIKALIEVRLGDADVALADTNAALPMYQNAFHRFLRR